MSELEEMRALARNGAARVTLEEVAHAFTCDDIPIVALKGAALALAVYPEGEARAFADVDVLVPERAFARASALLLDAGFRVVGHGPHDLSRTFVGHASPLPVDLHGALFSRLLFELDADGLYARSQRLPGLDGEVRRPHGLDLVAHAIGHYAKTRPPPCATTLGRDVKFALARDGITPAVAAQHLARSGLLRAAFYALPRAGEEEAHELLRALPRDPWSGPIVSAARALERAPLVTTRSVLSRHLLNRSLARGAASFCLHGLDAARSRLSRRP